MSQLRRDPVSRRWVIIATDRAKRPRDFVTEPRPQESRFCPFCEGNEQKTPFEILAYRDNGTQPNGPGWRVRVVPNKFPALRVEGEIDNQPDGLYDSMNGIGAHEVIIETPRHHLSLTDLSLKQIQDVLWVYRERLLDLERDKRMVYGMLFKNVGASAGSTVNHTHSQLIVTPIVPQTVGLEMSVAADYFRYRDRCLFCDIIAQERDCGERIVIDGGSFVAFAPYAARFPFETWILPARHEGHFKNHGRHDVEQLAVILKATLMKIERALDQPPYNYIIHTSPFNTKSLPDFHWHIEIIPRLTRIAGFEWGTGFYVNPVPPEDAAAFLRGVEADPNGEEGREKGK